MTAKPPRSSFSYIATAPAVVAASILVPSILVWRPFLPLLAPVFVLVAFAIVAGQRNIIGVRLASGLLLSGLVAATFALPVRHFRNDQTKCVILSTRVTELYGRVVADIRPNSSSYQFVDVALESVATADHWTGAASGRIRLFWEGPHHLIDRSGRSTLPLRGDRVIVPVRSGFPVDDRVFVSHDEVELTRRAAAGLEFRRRVREEIRRRLGRLPRRSRAVAVALLLGDRGDLPPAFVDRVRRAGASHALALSGMHLAIFAGVLLVCIKPLLALRMRFIAVSPFLFGYVWIVGAIPSLVRALILFTVVAVARLRGRRVPLIVALARTAVLAVLLTPELVSSLGFLLSTAALGGIVLWSYPLGLRLSTYLPRPIALYVAVGGAAILGTGAISLAVFDTVYPSGLVLGGIIASLVVLVVWTAVFTVIVAPVPFVGTVAIDVVNVLVAAIDVVAGIGATIPVAAGWAGVGLLAAMTTLVLPSRRRPVPAHEPRFDF